MVDRPQLADLYVDFDEVVRRSYACRNTDRGESYMTIRGIMPTAKALLGDMPPSPEQIQHWGESGIVRQRTRYAKPADRNGLKRFHEYVLSDVISTARGEFRPATVT